ncbi:hypothetical protein EWM64_g4140 [Hericium alpestre]|uniref:TATA box binding protein associated factor (TAF) histone-like fold domain-containing protein n=1 Tax=Hericium alpestre TaxID=135208 RepID=A0A4Z0A0B9_9AGAM|nr:hypothetical protein EWM64_g4140 [Hericium alpestre]
MSSTEYTKSSRYFPSLFTLVPPSQSSQEASRFMRHSRRTTLTTSDIDLALRVLNIEPLYGHSSAQTPAFRRAPPYSQMPNAGTVYFVEDEEIDFDRLLKEEKLSMPPGVRWTAHWLAVVSEQTLHRR